MPSRPHRIGLTGNIGSGKSTASGIFSSLGVPVFNADDVGHELLTTDKLIMNRIARLFGSRVITAGALDRKKIASIIFTDPDKKKTLEKILHPQIMRRIDARIRDTSDVTYVVVEAALIYEAHLAESFDYVILVTADKDISIERASKKLAINRKQALARLNAQMAQAEKEKVADFVISNNGSIDELKTKVGFVHSILSAICHGRPAVD